VGGIDRCDDVLHWSSSLNVVDRVEFVAAGHREDFTFPQHLSSRLSRTPKGNRSPGIHDAAPEYQVFPGLLLEMRALQVGGGALYRI
jgi:hypothetical protein